MSAQKRSTSNRSKSAPAKKKPTGASKAVPPPKRLDERSRNDILGVVITVLGIALFIAVVAPGGSPDQEGFNLARLVGTGLSYAFGFGSFIVPIALVIWGATFFIRRSEVSELRTGIGLGIAAVAIVSMLSLATPEIAVEPERVFDSISLQARGGYLGAAVAWLLVQVSRNTAIGYVILTGVLLSGLIIVGLSISGFVDWVRGLFEREEIPERTARTRAVKEPAQKFERGRVVRSEPDPTFDDIDADDEPVERPKRARKTALLSREGSEADTAVADPRAKTQAIVKGAAPRALEGFELPPATLLVTSPAARQTRSSEQEFKNTAQLLQDTLETFDIFARVVGWVVGPTVTMFKVEMPKGVRLSRVTNLADDLQLALAADTVRIMAPIPGTSLVGIEIPNMNRSSVTLGDVINKAAGGPLMLGIGKDVGGDSILTDLAKMPHLLIGGTTGSGKSVAINSMLMSILMRATPAEVRVILIDPKRVELSVYNGVPHLYVPVVTEPREAASALAWSVAEMERRLKQLQKAGVRNISSYNQLVQSGDAPEGMEELPYLVIVIDELADLMMVAAKEVEDSIVRIAQLARAAGIHLIVATQRPEANVVTGLIKANITNRIAFNVASSIDSRVILDQPGAEKLIGLGDMLFSIPEWGKPKRIQGAYVSDGEIEAVVEHLKSQAETDYHEEILTIRPASMGGGGGDGGDEDDDPLLWEAGDAVVSSGLGSTSMLQRRLRVGYARAGRIMDQLESKGVVGPPDGSKPREVLVDELELETLKAFEASDGDE